jgi:hypothetical protein
MDFESQFVKGDDKFIRAEQALQELSVEQKKALFEKMGLEYDSVSTKKKRKTRPVDERKAAKGLLNEKEKSVATDVIRTLGLNHKGRNFNRMFENFVWIKRKVSTLANESMGIDKDTRKDISLKQIEAFVNSGALLTIQQQCEDYFQKKLDEKRKK